MGDQPAVDTSKRVDRLFGTPVPSISDLRTLPALTSMEVFAVWKNQFRLYIQMLGMISFLDMNSIDSWAYAQSKYRGSDVPSLLDVYETYNERMITSIAIAVSLVIPDMSQIESAIRTDRENDAHAWPCLGVTGWSPAKDAFCIWSKVVSMSENKSAYSMLASYRAFTSFVYRDGMDFVTYQNEYNRLITECNKALAHDKPLPGNVFGESFKAAILLQGFPESMRVDAHILMARDQVLPADVFKLVKNTIDQRQQKATSSRGAYRSRHDDEVNAFYSEERRSKPSHGTNVCICRSPNCNRENRNRTRCNRTDHSKCNHRGYDRQHNRQDERRSPQSDGNPEQIMTLHECTSDSSDEDSAYEQCCSLFEEACM